MARIGTVEVEKLLVKSWKHKRIRVKSFTSRFLFFLPVASFFSKFLFHFTFEKLNLIRQFKLGLLSFDALIFHVRLRRGNRGVLMRRSKLKEIFVHKRFPDPYSGYIFITPNSCLLRVAASNFFKTSVRDFMSDVATNTTTTWCFGICTNAVVALAGDFNIKRNHRNEIPLCVKYTTCLSVTDQSNE